MTDIRYDTALPDRAAVLTALLQNSVRGNIRRQAWTIVQTHNFPKNTRCLINHFAPRTAVVAIMGRSG